MEPSLGAEVRLRVAEDGRILEASGACEEALRVPAAALLGRPVWEALRVDAPALKTLYARTAQGPTLDFLAEQSPATPTVTRVTEPRTCLRLHAVRRGDTCEVSVINLSEMLKGAPPLQVSRFSSSLSHELRNPLSSIKLAVQTLARNQAVGERDRRRLDIAHREIRTLERMLWMLSEYGRDTAPHLEAVTLQFLLQQASEMIEPELKERAVILDVQEPAETPRVLADLGRIRPVLAQLVLNIAMGLERGAPLKIHFRLEEGGTGAVLGLEDPASELLPEERSTLFEPFGSRLARGAGLSLAALRQVMRQQEGEVTAEPLASGGTLFLLCFPGVP